MSRQQPAEVRRQRILDAAAALLVREGLQRTSMEAVASAAGIAKGTVYLYFRSRAELLAALRRRYSEDLGRRAESVLSSASGSDAVSLAATYQRLVADLTGYLLANGRLHHVLFQEAGVSEEETMEPLRRLVRSSLQAAMDAGTIAAMDTDTLMRFLVDGLHGAVVPLFHQKAPGRRRVLAGLAEIIRRLLMPATAGLEADGGAMSQT